MYMYVYILYIDYPRHLAHAQKPIPITASIPEAKLALSPLLDTEFPLSPGRIEHHCRPRSILSIRARLSLRRRRFDQGASPISQVRAWETEDLLHFGLCLFFLFCRVLPRLVLARKVGRLIISALRYREEVAGACLSRALGLTYYSSSMLCACNEAGGCIRHSMYVSMAVLLMNIRSPRFYILPLLLCYYKTTGPFRYRHRHMPASCLRTIDRAEIPLGLSRPAPWTSTQSDPLPSSTVLLFSRRSMPFAKHTRSCRHIPQQPPATGQG